MSFYLYDKAIIDRLKDVTGDDRIHIVPPEQAISFLAQFDKDKVKLPALVLSRGPITIVDALKNQVAYLKGETAKYNTEENSVSKARLIPIRIEWSLNVYTVDRYSCDEIVRELVFYLMTKPRFSVKIPYDLDIEQNFDIFLDNDIVDNSDLIEFPNTGEYFRETISFYTENAHLYSSNRIYLTKLLPDVEDNN